MKDWILIAAVAGSFVISIINLILIIGLKHDLTEWTEPAEIQDTPAVVSSEEMVNLNEGEIIEEDSIEDTKELDAEGLYDNWVNWSWDNETDIEELNVFEPAKMQYKLEKSDGTIVKEDFTSCIGEDPNSIWRTISIGASHFLGSDININGNTITGTNGEWEWDKENATFKQNKKINGISYIITYSFEKKE